MSRYTVIDDTRRMSATSATVRNRARCCVICLLRSGTHPTRPGEMGEEGNLRLWGAQSYVTRRWTSPPHPSVAELAGPVGGGDHRLEEGAPHPGGLQHPQPRRGGA